MLSAKLSTSPRAGSSFLSSLKFESCLGYGGFGIVLKAVDATSSSLAATPSAVKFIFPTESNDKEQQQIIRECTLAKDFIHENIVRILNIEEQQFNAKEIKSVFANVSTTDRRLLSEIDKYIGQAKRFSTLESICVQMELCGETLRNWLNQDHDLNTDKTQAQQSIICHGAISGLKYLHDNKIIHRDLKPENIMFSQPDFGGPVKIGDFGLCRILHSSETQTNTLTSRTGTKEYMAPELYTNEYSYQADLFSLGLIIWEVFQLIKFSDRRKLFDSLVNDKENSLVKDIESIPGIKALILNLTKRKEEDRTPSIDVVIKMFDSSICIFVKNSTELTTALKKVRSGCRVVLSEGEFEGEFILEKDDVEIEGAGDGKTVLKGLKGGTCLKVKGNGCSVAGLKVILIGGSCGIKLHGSQNRIENVEGFGHLKCLRVKGDENRLKHLTISNSFYGITIQGCKNTLDEVKLQNIGLHGINLHSNSDYNLISNVSGLNVKTGIRVEGSKNDLSHIHLQKRVEDDYFQGLEFCAGSWNTVSNLITSGYFRNLNDWGVLIMSTKFTLTDSACGPTFVNGSHTTLTNVDCGELIQFGMHAEGTNLTNFKAWKPIPMICRIPW